MAGIGRFQHTGGAPGTTLSISMLSTDTSFTTASGVGYPDGSVGDFVVAVDPGLPSEEHILCSSRSGAVFTVAGGLSGRGYDNTSAAGHTAPTAVVEHIVAAIEIDDASRHINPTGGTPSDDHLNYPLLTGARAFTGAISGSSTSTFTKQIATLTGTNGSYVGQTNGAPLSGTFSTGDFASDPTNTGLWICTSGGSPGTWAPIGGLVAGSMHATNVGTTVGSGSSATIATTSDYALGGVTIGSNALVVPQAGYYLVNIHCTWSMTTTGEVDATIVKNGSTGIAAARSYGVSPLEVSNHCTQPVLLAANDSLTLLASNQTAGNNNVLGNTTVDTWLAVVKMAL